MHEYMNKIRARQFGFYNSTRKVMADKTLEKVEEEYKDQRVTGNQDNGTQHGQKGSSTSHKSAKHSKGGSSAGHASGGSKGGHSN
ncbi:hypothetical protein GCM10028825_01260 [Spirosoma agri]